MMRIGVGFVMSWWKFGRFADRTPRVGGQLGKSCPTPAILICMDSKFLPIPQGKYNSPGVYFTFPLYHHVFSYR